MKKLYKIPFSKLTFPEIKLNNTINTNDILTLKLIFKLQKQRPIIENKKAPKGLSVQVGQDYNFNTNSPIVAQIVLSAKLQ